MIFRFATSGSLQLDETVSSYSPPYIKDMGQKRTIVLVSKLWNNIATHILYESVLINKSEKLWQFSSTLKLKNNLYYGSEGRARQSYGSFVRILKIEGDMDATRVAPTLLSALERCTNLKVLGLHLSAFGLGRYKVSEVENAMLKHHSGSLRHFEAGASTSWAGLWDTLQHFPLLETISLFPGGYALLQSRPLFLFNRLHTLRAVDVSMGLLSHSVAAWDMPALQNLIFVRLERDHSGNGFFEAHGRKIRSLMLIGGHGKDHTDYFAYARPYLTSLRHLSLTGILDKASPTTPYFLSYCDVEVQVDLDLTVTQDELQRAFHMNPTLAKAMSDFKSIFDLTKTPLIGSVQMLVYTNSELLKRARNMYLGEVSWRCSREWIEEWASCGVRLLDSEGNLLQIPPSLW